MKIHPVVPRGQADVWMDGQT